MQELTRRRSAGILLHVTSLPSSFGIGDIGPEAYRFAEFLQRNGQGYWQILPLTPVEKDHGYSPYSSVSGMAGNTLLISPELMEEEGWLKPDDLLPHRLGFSAKADFAGATRARQILFRKAYERSRLQNQEPFESF